MNNSRRRKQHTRGRTLRFYSIAVVAVAAAAAVGFLYFVYTPLLPPAAAGSQATAGKTFSSKNSGSVNLNFLYSPNAVLINRETGSALAENNSAQRIYPASLTKIMTAVLAIEHTKDLNSTITLPYGFLKGCMKRVPLWRALRRVKRLRIGIYYTEYSSRRAPNAVWRLPKGYPAQRKRLQG